MGYVHFDNNHAAFFVLVNMKHYHNAIYTHYE